MVHNSATRKKTAKGVVSSMCVPIQNLKADSGTEETKQLLDAESKLQKASKKRKRHGIYLIDTETELPASKRTSELLYAESRLQKAGKKRKTHGISETELPASKRTSELLDDESRLQKEEEAWNLS